MDRRNFFKLVGTASGGAAAGACGKQAEEIIPLLVPAEEIVPGVEEWHPAVCGECAAACGTMARVMSSEREIVVGGERARQRIAAIKKLEGNPADPVSGGRLCARGHAALQSLYNPDRLQGPLRRVGKRGDGQFEPVDWPSAIQEAGEAIAAAADSDPSRIAYLARPRTDLKAASIARFLDACGGGGAVSIGVGDFAPEIEGARRAFGWDGIPVYDIGEATLVLSIGADFLGGWVSPVLYSRGYGHMRQGRTELRGRLIHAESRFSLTAWNADRWLPVLPGGELALALGIGRMLVSERAAPGIAGAPRAVVSLFGDVDLSWATGVSGIGADAMRETAAALAAASAPVVIAGASIVRPNSADAVAAAGALNLLLGRVGKPGGVMPPSVSGSGLESARPSCRGWVERLRRAVVILVDGVNPAYNAPFARDLLTGAGKVISFSSFLDETAACADLILPDHDPLERPALAAPAVSPVPSLAASAAFVAPLYDTKPTEDVLAALAEAIGRPFEPLTQDAILVRLRESLGETEGGPSAAEFSAETLERGGWQGQRETPTAAPESSLGSLARNSRAHPLVFQAYPSVQFGEGSGANRPWLQELPDPVSSAMWSAPVELDPGTAAGIGVRTGDRVRVRSTRGSLEAPVYVDPAAIPGVASMALGQGHERYGRYAAGRGANPMSVIGNLPEAATGATALGPVPVTIERTGEAGGLIQFSQQDRNVAPSRV